MKNTRTDRNRRGFTLIELMIVIAIIGVLSAIGIPNFLNYRAKAQNSAAEVEARNFYDTAMSHYADIGSATTFSAAAQPNSHVRNSDIDYTGSVSVNLDGATTGTMTFSHSNRSTTYTLTGSTGAIAS